MQLVRQVTGMLLILMLALAGATHYAAYYLQGKAALGTPLVVIGTRAYYPPWYFIRWMVQMGPHHPVIFQRGCLGLSFGALLCVLYALILRRNPSSPDKALETYGSARWISHRELIRSDLVKSRGVFLGRVGKYFIRHDGPEHVIAIAPTRSGKGVGLVIPTLLSWPASVLVYDIKGENWSVTSGFRSGVSHCIYFNPTHHKSARFNPLLEVRQGDHEVQDVQNIADILVEPDGGSDKRDYWSKTGHVLLVAAILHILYTEEDKTLSGVANFLADPKRDIHSTLDLMLNTCHLGDRPHPVIASAAREMLNKSPNELSGVVSTAMSFLGLYRDPIVARATSCSDFCIRDLMHADKPVSLYIVVPPSDMSRTRPLIRLMLNQICRRVTQETSTYAQPLYKHRLLMMIDEFPSLGRLDFFETTMAFSASYGVKCYLIAQSLNQLDRIYGAHHALLDHCHVRVIFSTNDDRTAKRVSDLLGQSTHRKKHVHHSGNVSGIILKHISVGEHESARPLLTPGEISTLPFTDSLIFVGGMHPLRAKKIRYYDDKNFLRRCLPPPYLLSPEEAPLPIQAAPSVWLSKRYVRSILDTIPIEEHTLPE